MEARLQVTSSGAVSAPLHPREEERIARLLGFDILDTAKDPLLDRLTRIASQITGSPISLLSFVDRHRQWIKAKYGCEIEQSIREDSFCSHTILNNNDDPLIVTDTEKDPRFATNPFVTGDPHIRFYAGIPLQVGDGLPIGSLCVIDSKPKTLTEEQIKELQSLAAVAMDYINVHRSNRELTNLLMREKEIYNRLLKMSAEMTQEPHSLESALQRIMNHLDPNLGWLSCRFTNLLKDGGSYMRMNPLLPKDPEVDLLWRDIDSNEVKTIHEVSRTEFISTGISRPEYAYLVVPISVSGRRVAKIEMIYPDHRRMDVRMKDVFDLMAFNLAIVAERELLNFDLRHRAMHDPLTGAVNRTLFLSELGKAIAEADPPKPDSVLLFLDPDGFKEVNDNFGHQIGDRLLIEVTDRLRGLCREKDVLGRLSGDEFVLLIRDIHISNDLEPLLKRIRRNLLQPFMLGDLEIRISTSIGAAVLDRRDLKIPELLRRSEEAMYLVKNGERKGYCIADEAIISKFQHRLNLDHEMHEAVYQRRLTLHFQPIVDLLTGKVCSSEALLRVTDKKGKLLEASDFISSLERIRLMPDVDEWVFAEAIRTIRQNIQIFNSIPGFRISLNVSPAILTTHDYGSISLNRLKVLDICPSMLRLEIIEDHLDMNNASLLENITLLRNAGVSIAIDDFGTGYSNLKHLTTIPCDSIKIDRTFLKGIVSGDSTSNKLLSAIVNLGKDLGYSVIAEGIESQEQANHLFELGCQYGQGYFYGKPMPIGDFIRHLSHNTLLELDFHSPHCLESSVK